jgi:GYF domain 2
MRINPNRRPLHRLTPDSLILLVHDTGTTTEVKSRSTPFLPKKIINPVASGLLLSGPALENRPMQWYYSSNGQQLGPVSDTEFEALVRVGTVTTQSLVWREGFPNWTPYTHPGSGALVSTSPTPPPVDAARCGECDKIFSKSEMVHFENSYICAGCKPHFFQKLREGVSTMPAGSFRRAGRNLVCSVQATLPKRCVKCNTPTETKQIKRTLYWHSPFFFFLIVLNILIFAIVAMIVRKRAVAFVSICPQHRKMRRNAILTSWALVIGSIVVLITSAGYQSGWIAAAGGVLFIVGITYGIVRGRLVSAKKIDKEFLWLSGCGPEFLAAFPDWTGAR